MIVVYCREVEYPVSLCDMWIVDFGIFNFLALKKSKVKTSLFNGRDYPFARL